jgi:CSLREA domain-containing protein
MEEKPDAATLPRDQQHLRSRGSLGPALALAAFAALAVPAGAATIVVDSLADGDPVHDGECTLREAILHANGDFVTLDCDEGSDQDTIVFTVSGTILLGSPLPTVTDPQGLIIDAGDQAVTLSGQETVQVLHVAAGAVLELRGLTVANGRASSGGGIRNQGTLTAHACTFSGNSALLGGGISNEAGASLTVHACTFSDNHEPREQDGGGIHNDGTLTVSDSTFSGISSRFGSGIFNEAGATLAVSGSTFSDNSSSSGGGILNWGSLTVTACNFSGNRAFDDGGGIFNLGSLTVTASIFSGNNASSLGGGILGWGSVTVSGSTFSDNSSSSGGGISGWESVTVTASTFSGNSGLGGGGAISNHHGTLTVTGSTFSNNSAFNSGGAIGSSGVLTVANSTFSGNSVSFRSPGGGIYFVGSTASIRNSTFSANVAAPGFAGANVANNLSTGNLTLSNAIVADGIGLGNCSGTVTDGGGNLFWPAEDTSCPGTAGDPMLAPLADNGGPTHTMALPPGSAAIDAGDPHICEDEPVENLDQRGVGRPIDGDGDGLAVCDVGAFEAPEGTSPTQTPTATLTPTPSATAAETPTATVTPTSSATATETSTATMTPTATATSTPTAIATPTATATATPTGTATATPTLTATPTATATATATPTSGPLCGRSDGCMHWELLEADFSVQDQLRLLWRLRSDCPDPLSRASFRFVPGVTVLETAGGTYTSAAHEYGIELAGDTHAGIDFVPSDGDPIAGGESDLFAFRLASSGLTADTVLWNAAEAGAAEQGRIDMRSSLCFAVPLSSIGAAELVAAESASARLALVLAALLVAAALSRRRRVR